MQTLLEKAREVKLMREKKDPVDDGQIEVVMAYLHDEISFKQLAVATELSTSQVGSFITRVLMNGVRDGKLIVKPI